MEDDAKEKSEETENSVKNGKSEALKPNKSTLHTIVNLSNLKTGGEVFKEENEESKDSEEVEKKMQKNVSTLYRIISSQSAILKPLNGSDDIVIDKDYDDEDNDDKDDAEYENIIHSPSSDIIRTDPIDNTIYYVKENKTIGDSKSATKNKKSSEWKKSSVEIRISPPSLKDSSSPKSLSTLESSKSSTDAPFSSCKIIKCNSETVANLGDLSEIRFSFLDDKDQEETKWKRDSEYDTINESTAILEIANPRDFTKHYDSSGAENFYSSPRISTKSQSISKEISTSVEEYVASDREVSGSTEWNSELFYAASEVLDGLIPDSSSHEIKESMYYEDVEMEKKETAGKPMQETFELEEYADVDVNDYCRHRAENPKKLSLNPKEKKAIVRVRSKINKAWKSMKNWMNEDRDATETPPTSKLPRSPTTIDMIKVLREESEVVKIEKPETTNSSSECVPRLCFLNDNINDQSSEGKENPDSGTYVDMTRSPTDEGSGDLFPGLSLLRKRKEATSGSPSFRKSRYYPESQNGFDELRRYIKQGGDFCKELSVILQERSEAENQYAKSLSKLSHKLLKTSKDAVGSVAEAWQRIGAEMEVQSEVHRNFAAALNEEVVKSLKQLIESQHRIRKNVEGVVEKTGKTLTEWRQAEGKSKKQSFLCARENEKLQDTMLDPRNVRNASTLQLSHNQNYHKNISDKETAKMDLKRKKAEESVKKADIEYYSFCVRAERCRLDWESAVTRGGHCFQSLEEERLACLKNLASCYLKHFKEIGPRILQSCDRLAEPIESCDITRDIQTVVLLRGSSQPVQEQLLPDFYAEHVTLAMNRDRRKQALVKLLKLIMQDLEREKRGKEGVENLQRALQQTPNFGAEESQQDVDEKLHHMKSMLIYLEAARYKVQSALTELEGNPKQPHPLGSFIHMTRDRQGLQQSVLRVPCWVKNDSVGDQTGQESPVWTGRESGDGTSVQPDSDFDEFSSVESDKDYQCSVYNVPIISACKENGEKVELGQCRALYEYTAKVYDELNLRIGDIIKIHDKHPDGWWLGELDGVVGIFPATYVEEIN